MIVKIDKDLCIGCGLCVEICPAVFQMDEDGKAALKADSIPKGQEDKVRESASSCPVNAIIVKE